MKNWISRLDGIEHKASHWYYAEEHDGKWYVMDKQTTDTWIERHSFQSRKEAKQAIPQIIKFWKKEPYERKPSEKNSSDDHSSTQLRYVVSQKGDKWYVVQRMEFFMDAEDDEAYNTKDEAKKKIPKVIKEWENQFDWWGAKEWSREVAFFKEFGFDDNRESYMAWMDSHTHEERMEKLNQLRKHGMCDINCGIGYIDSYKRIKASAETTHITREEAFEKFGDVPEYVNIIEDIEGNYYFIDDGEDAQ